VKRKGKLREATEVLLQEVENEIEVKEKELEQLNKERSMLLKKLSDN
jgi:hypothetical protein